MPQFLAIAREHLWVMPFILLWFAKFIHARKVGWKEALA